MKRHLLVLISACMTISGCAGSCYSGNQAACDELPDYPTSSYVAPTYNYVTPAYVAPQYRYQAPTSSTYYPPSKHSDCWALHANDPYYTCGVQ